MQDDQIEQLNQRFGVPGHLAFVAGPGGLPLAEIHNAHATATVALHGAQPLAFQPRGMRPVLFVSSSAVYADGKALRGGIPICWPWFGPHPDDPSKPAHGFVRTRMWQVLETGGAPGGATSLRLGLSDDASTSALWPHAFEIELAVLVGALLQVELLVRNPGVTPFTFTGALHSYFSIGDLASVAIHGLDGVEYIDKVDADRRKRQAGAVRFERETDRVYLDTDAACTIDDPVLARTIEIAKHGSRSTVVWNPWQEKSRRMGDLGDEDYRTMVCVETANAADDRIVVPPGGEHRVALRISARTA